jgi:hypothetical protein
MPILPTSVQVRGQTQCIEIGGGQPAGLAEFDRKDAGAVAVSTGVVVAFAQGPNQRNGLRCDGRRCRS